MLNTITVMGRLTKDPESRMTSTEKLVVRFTLAVERDYAPQGAERQADFFDVVTWGNTAKFAERYFTKGQRAVVHGRLQNERWTDKEGNKHQKDVINAEHIYFADSIGAGKPGESSAPAAEFEDMDETDDDVPF